MTGKPHYDLDYNREGMKYAVFLRHPAFGQKLKSFDDSGTKAINGDEIVLKFSDEYGEKIAILANTTGATMKGKNTLVAG